MTAVLFGLLAAVLQISGTYSFQYFEEHDSLTRPWPGHHPISRDYRKFRNHEKYGDIHHFRVDSRRRFSNSEQNLDYQLFPSNWFDYKKDSEKLISPSRLRNDLSSDSSITSPLSRLKWMKHLKALPKESREELYSNLFFKYRPIVLNTSSLRSPDDASDGVVSLNIGRSTVSYKNDVQHTSDTQDNDFSAPALQAITSIDEVANETSTVLEEMKEAEDRARNDTLIEKDSIKNSMVIERQNYSAEDKESSIKIDQEQEGKNDSTEETTLVEEESTKAESVHEDGPDLNESTDFKTSNISLIENEANETKSVQDDEEEIKNDDDETSETTTDVISRTTTDVISKTTTEVISKSTPDNSNESEDTVSTNSQITSTEEVPGNSLEDTSETVHSSSTSILNETALPVNVSSSETTQMSSSDSSPSEAVLLTTKFPGSTKDVSEAPISPTLSREITDASSKDESPTFTESKFSKSEFVTEAISATPEHVIDIPSIRKAKIVISVVFLVIGLIAVAVLAVYMFRERRKAVKYDQLKLLP